MILEVQFPSNHKKSAIWRDLVACFPSKSPNYYSYPLIDDYLDASAAGTAGTAGTS